MKNIEKHESIRFENQAGVYIGYAVELSNLLETAEESQIWEIETAIRTLIYLAEHNLKINTKHG